MFIAEWVDMTEDDEETVTSSFLEQVTWRTERPDPFDPDTKGELVVWISNRGDGRKQYRYTNVERSVYETIRNEAYTGNKPGGVFNRLVRQDETIEAVDKEVPTA